ncbi:periplasmic divalent manganese/zinc-binding lipoprotein [Clostridia bacterium]|nr:periplasmic divalent manganese/zinc-binding lipoprotein [Clostridia bacterium]
MLKKIIAIILAVAFVSMLFACSDTAEVGDGKFTVVASLFPQYDFARTIAGDRADVTLLLPPGTESHSFDPTPSDMVTLNKADLFLYTGAAMEPWAAGVIAGATDGGLVAVDCSEGITLIDDEHEDEDEESDHEEDAHIWLNLLNAVRMVDHILTSFCEKDPDGADYYAERAGKLKEDLNALDSEILSAVDNADRKTIVFGGKFSYIYFLERYGLDYVTAYESCAANDEPSVGKIADVISFIKANNIPVIYHEELSDPKIARAIADETGCEMKLFATAHNVTRNEFESGVTYLDIMRGNLENLKAGLN